MLRAHATQDPAASHRHAGIAQRLPLRSFVIGLTAFLTVVDLFATQAILPALATAYRVSPAAIGLAVNASTLGMAIAGLAVAFYGGRIDRRRAICASLALLAVPTALLAHAPDLTAFAALRIAQGLFMSTAFALTLSYLAEQCSAAESAGAFAAYITGNVASNLFGRLLAAAFTDHLGLAGNFYLFAALNLGGAALVYATLAAGPPKTSAKSNSLASIARSPLSVLAGLLRSPRLRPAFAIGFLILFAFIGTFTYVNFVLVREPLALGMMQVGFVYFVFLPSILTTPLAGRAVASCGTRATLQGGLVLALAGLPLTLVGALPAVLAGLALIGIGTFLAQATATGHVGRAAGEDRGAASGLYLACYFLGGIAGSAVLGLLFERSGWGACVAGIGAALLGAALLAARIEGDARRTP